MSQSRSFDFPEVGERKAYLLYHEELESLVKHIRWAQAHSFLDDLRRRVHHAPSRSSERRDDGHRSDRVRGPRDRPDSVLESAAARPVDARRELHRQDEHRLLDRRAQRREPRKVFIYNVCDHEESWKEVSAQAVSYTTGVPTMVGAKMMLTNQWRGKRRVQHRAARPRTLPRRARRARSPLAREGDVVLPCDELDLTAWIRRPT